MYVCVCVCVHVYIFQIFFFSLQDCLPKPWSVPHIFQTEVYDACPGSEVIWSRLKWSGADLSDLEQT